MVQPAPFIVAGTGVPGVAWAPDRELSPLGADVHSFAGEVAAKRAGEAAAGATS
jgi:hypothetical protein